jgi:hypothetical protein
MNVARMAVFQANTTETTAAQYNAVLQHSCTRVHTLLHSVQCKQSVSSAAGGSEHASLVIAARYQ